VFNLASPNHNAALAKVAVRQAISYGINRSHLLLVLGGPILNPPLTHILPDGINGAQHVPRGYNRYPYNPAKARSMLADRQARRDYGAAYAAATPPSTTGVECNSGGRGRDDGPSDD
jgi:ABC-type transport system substrate-binding protein